MGRRRGVSGSSEDRASLLPLGPPFRRHASRRTIKAIGGVGRISRRHVSSAGTIQRPFHFRIRSRFLIENRRRIKGCGGIRRAVLFHRNSARRIGNTRGKAHVGI